MKTPPFGPRGQQTAVPNPHIWRPFPYPPPGDALGWVWSPQVRIIRKLINLAYLGNGYIALSHFKYILSKIGYFLEYFDMVILMTGDKIIYRFRK